MISKLNRETVEKVSLLARLRFSPSELDQLTSQLSEVVSYIDQLNALDTSGVEPLAHPLDLVNVFADDEVLPSLPREQALANSAKHDDACYRVPAVLGD